MIHFKREYLDKELTSEVGKDDLEAYWKETTAYPEMPLEVRWEQYYWMQEQGVYYCYTARDEEDLIGYAGYIVSSTLHQSNVLTAGHDILYIHPDWRGGGIGRGLIESAEKDLKENNVAIIQHHISSRFDFSPMIKKMGYKCTDMIYSRRLDDA